MQFALGLYVRVVLETIWEQASVQPDGNLDTIPEVEYLQPVSVMDALLDRYRFLIQPEDISRLFGFLSDCEGVELQDLSLDTETLSRFRQRAYKIAQIFQEISPPSVRSIYVV